MIADKHSDAGVFEAVDGAIHEFDYGEAASPCQTKILLMAGNSSSRLMLQSNSTLVLFGTNKFKPRSDTALLNKFYRSHIKYMRRAKIYFAHCLA
jgi:hypothetical protein